MNKTNNVLGIVAEYNPFHNGHLYQLEECKKISNSQYTVAIMSGNFTQRGEVALLNKWTRARMAILQGVDHVIELPFFYGCNSAEYFAKGAIKILNGLGCITHIGFGSEIGDVDKLKAVAKKLAYETDEFKGEISKFLSKGMSYPKARSMSLGENAHILDEPNNILGVEYIKQLILSESQIEPITITRHQVGYLEKSIRENISSGTHIRDLLKRDALSFKSFEAANLGVSQSTFEMIIKQKEHLFFNDDDKLFQMLRYKILSSSQEELSHIFAVSEGIENKILKEIRKANSLDELIDSIKSKRYTRTRIQRILIHILVSFTKNQKEPNYIRILGFNEKGSKLLKEIKRKELNTMPILTNINKQKDIYSNLDIRANDIYNIMCGNNIYDLSDFVKQPEIVYEK